MDATPIFPPRRLTVPIQNRWGGGDLSVLDFGDDARFVDLVFAHANGFNAMTYRSLLAPLAGSRRIWAPDLRGHGRTTLPTRMEGRRSWLDHRDDLIALLDAVDGPPVVLAGHSMGGTAAILAAAERPERVSKLVLLDPVIWTRLAVAAFQLPVFDRMSSHIPMVRSTLRRRRLFDSREQAMAAYVGRGAFKGWPEIMIADYLADGLIQTDDGFALACSPEWEASNYGAQSHDPWRALRRFGGPVQILKAQTGSICHVPLRPWGLPNVSVEVVEGGGHLFPMTRADVARDTLFEAVV